MKASTALTNGPRRRRVGTVTVTLSSAMALGAKARRIAALSRYMLRWGLELRPIAPSRRQAWRTVLVAAVMPLRNRYRSFANARSLWRSPD